MSFFRNVLAIGVLGLLASCLSMVNVTRAQGGLTVQSIALMPSGGLLADAVGTELLSSGFDVYDTATVSNLLIRSNITEVEIMQPANLASLKEKGIDGLLNLRTSIGYDGKPQSATFRIISTLNGKLVVGGSWNNSQFGAQGSQLDNMTRQDLNSTAKQIAKEIAKALNR